MGFLEGSEMRQMNDARKYKTADEIASLIGKQFVTQESGLIKHNGKKIVGIKELTDEDYDRWLTNDDGTYEINTMFAVTLDDSTRLDVFEDEIAD